MELRHLRYFVAAAEEENLTRAAARLHLSQPPLSRQIRDLEEELGLTLFHREPKSIRLTANGKVFLEEAVAVLDRAEEAQKTAKALAEGNLAEFHVGFAPSLTLDVLPAALRYFQTACPEVQTRLSDLSTEEMLKRLREDDIDAALLIQPPKKALRGLEFVELLRKAVCVAAHPSHPLIKRKKIGLPQLADDRLITYSKIEYPEYHSWLEGLFARRKLAPRIAEEHDGSTSLIASVEAGRGVALVQEGF